MKTRSESSAGNSSRPAEEENIQTELQKENWKRRLHLWNYLLRTTIPSLPSFSSSPLPKTDEEFLRRVENRWGEWKKELIKRKMICFPLLSSEIGEFILNLSQLPKEKRKEKLENIDQWILDEITDQELIEL